MGFWWATLSIFSHKMADVDRSCSCIVAGFSITWITGPSPFHFSCISRLSVRTQVIGSTNLTDIVDSHRDHFHLRHRGTELAPPKSQHPPYLLFVGCFAECPPHTHDFCSTHPSQQEHSECDGSFIHCWWNVRGPCYHARRIFSPVRCELHTVHCSVGCSKSRRAYLHPNPRLHSGSCHPYYIFPTHWGLFYLIWGDRSSHRSSSYCESQTAEH